MVVCQSFLHRNCKFGDSCRNEHPGVKQGGFGNNGWVNRASGSSSNSTPKGNLLPYNAANIACDISPTQDKPLWPLSAYGPAKYEPNLIGGLDESAEELRVKATTAIRAGNVNEYLQYETTKIAAADSVFANARANSTQAFEQAAKQSNFPALVAAASASKSSSSGGSGSAFPSNSSAFGSTSTFGGTTTPSAFGNTTTTPSAFGNTTTPSAFGNLGGTAPTSAFGQPSFGKSAFGQSAFGQPSFGQPATPNALPSTGSAFGQTSTPGTTSAFGQTSLTSPTSAFGQASNPTTSAFGQPQNTTAPASAFGQPQQSTSAFGQPAQPPTTTSAFGQPSFGQAPQSPTSSSVIKPASGAFSAFANNGTPSPFGSTANTTGSTAGGAFSAFAGQSSAFGLGAGANPQQQSGGSVFGQPGFGQPAPAAPANTNTTTSAFGNLGQNNTGTTSVFGTPSFGQQTTAPASAFSSGSATTTGPAFGQTGFGNAGSTSGFGAGVQAPSAFGNTSAPPTTNPQHLSVFPTAPSISLSMNSPNTPGSTPRSGPVSASTLDAPDFAGLIKKGGLYNPNATPYDSQLPSNYIELLPKEIVDAFNGDKFTWGSVPDWVPPVEVR